MRWGLLALAILLTCGALLLREERPRIRVARPESAPDRAAVPPPSPPAGLRLSGHVTDIAGRPLSAGVVQALSCNEIVATASAEETGRWALRLPGPGSYALRAFAPAHSQEAEPARNFGEDRDGLDFRLRPTPGISGVVVDTEGRPAAAVRVTAVSLDPFQPAGMPPLEAVTGPDGSFWLPARRGAEYLVLGRVLRAPVRGARLSATGGTPSNLALETGVVEGVVRSGRGPVAGAEVSAGGVTTLAGPEGAFVLSEVPLGANDLTARHPDFLPEPRRTEWLFLRGARHTRLDLWMRPAAHVRGVVVDTTDRPQPGAEVWIRAPDLPLPAQVADESGRFDFGSLEPGRRVTVLARHRSSGLSAPTTIIAGEGEGRVVLPGGVAITGRVIDADGRPVADAEVHVRVRSGEVGNPYGYGWGPEFPPAPPAFTDAEGAFTLYGAPPGELTVVASHADFAESEVAISIPADSAQWAMDPIRLERGLLLRGRAVNEKGSPVAGARARAERIRADSGPGRTHADSTTGPDGAFAFTGLAPGTFRVALATDTLCGEAEIAAGGEETVIQMRPAGFLAGRVLGDGEPLAGAAVSVENLPQVTTKEDGTFRLGPLPAGTTFTVNVHHQLYGEATLRVSPPAPDIEIALAGGRKIEGIVVDPEGHPLAQVEVEVRAGEQVASVRTGADGRFRAGGIPEGPVAVRTTESGRNLVEGEWQEVAGGEIRLVARRGEQIEGILLRADGTPEGGVRVEARDAAGEVVDYTLTLRGDGSFELRGLPPGSYRIVAVGGPEAPDVPAGTRGLRLQRPPPGMR